MKQTYIFFIVVIASTYIPDSWARRQHSSYRAGGRTSTFRSRSPHSTRSYYGRGTTRLSANRFNTGSRRGSSTQTMRNFAGNRMPSKTRAGYYSRPDYAHNARRHNRTHTHHHNHKNRHPFSRRNFGFNGGGFGGGGFGGGCGWGDCGFGLGWGPFWGWGPGYGGYADQAPSPTYIINDQRTCDNCSPSDYYDEEEELYT